MSLNLRICTLLIVVALVPACAGYSGPTEGELAKVVLKSNSTYNDVAVDFCYDPECEDARRIGLLAGDRFISKWYDDDSVPKIYANRIQHEISVYANEISAVRFTTIKDVIHYGDTPHVEQKFKEYHGLGIVIVERSVSYVESEIEVRCDAIVQVEPVASTRLLVMHDHDDDTELCNATVTSIDAP